MQLINLAGRPASEHDFVRFWSGIYRDPREYLYEQNIGVPIGREQLEALFVWKNGGHLWRQQRITFEENFAPMPDMPRGDTTELVSFICLKGGPIWRIFYLHCPRAADVPDLRSARLQGNALDQWSGTV